MIYLDYAAATPMSEKARKAAEPYLSELFFNPSAPYLPAKRVREAYEDAKAKIAHVIGAKGNDIVITSGATEATNLAFSAVGVLASHDANPSLKKPLRDLRRSCHPDHLKILVLETEHASVIQTAKKYNYETIKVQRNGLIDLDDLKTKLDESVVLVSVSLANNETGTIQPFAEIAEVVEAERQRRLENDIKTPLLLHSDASQALNLLNVNIARLKIDLLTMSAAKVYGPKGVGALYVSHKVRLEPITTGGGQERGLRSGTENVAGVMAFAEAATDAKEHLNGNRKKYEKLRKMFKDELLRLVKTEVEFIGAEKHQLANFCPLCFPGLDAERLIYKLEDEGIYVSTGAACAASKGEKSHVLKAMGLSDAEIAGSLRVSFGAQNTEEDIMVAAAKIAEAANAEFERLNHA